MGALDIKTELKELIENESDTNILEALKTLLIKSNLNSVTKEKLTSRALKAEEDIAQGRTMNRQELERDLDSKLNLWK
jgi:hypothetical protein